MGLEGIMLYKMSAEKNKYCIYSHMEFKNVKLMETEGRLVVIRGWSVVKWEILVKW